MGALAVKTLVEKIEGREGKLSTKEILLKPELIIRKTCGFQLKGYQLKEMEKGIGPFSLDHLSR
jgi:hypothetical protein